MSGWVRTYASGLMQPHVEAGIMEPVMSDEMTAKKQSDLATKQRAQEIWDDIFAVTGSVRAEEEVVIIAGGIRAAEDAALERAARRCEYLGWGNDEKVNPAAGSACAAAIRAMKSKP